MRIDCSVDVIQQIRCAGQPLVDLASEVPLGNLDQLR